MKDFYYSRVVIDIGTGDVLDCDIVPYDGPWQELKESAAEKQQRLQMNQLQIQAANRQASNEDAYSQMMKNYYNIDLPQQRDFQNRQMDMYNTQAQREQQLAEEYLGMQKDQFSQYKQLLMGQIGKQNSLIDPVTSAMTPYLSATTGFDPATTKMLNDAAIEDLNRGYRTASSTMYGDLLSRGFKGDMPAGGDLGRMSAGLQSGLATGIADARRNTNLESIKQALANKFSAASTMMSGAGLIGSNIGTFTGASNNAVSGFGSGVGLTAPRAPVAGGLSAPTAAQPSAGFSQFAPLPKPPSFWGQLGGSVLGTAAQGLGMGLTGGIGGLFSSFQNLFKPQTFSSPYANMNFSSGAYG